LAAPPRISRRCKIRGCAASYAITDDALLGSAPAWTIEYSSRIPETSSTLPRQKPGSRSFALSLILLHLLRSSDGGPWARGEFMKIALSILLAGLLAGGAYLAAAAAGEKSPQEKREAADAAVKKGNFKDAFNLFSGLALDPADDAGKVSHDLTQAIVCLNRLGRVEEIDDFREKVISAHAHNWRLLQTAAQSFLTGNHNYGYIIAGKFYRGNHRGGDGKVVYTVERDRIRALQLMQQALDDVEKEPNKTERGTFYFALADMLLNNRYGGGSWQLQFLTDLSKLPDYEDGYPSYYYGGRENKGAPVNEDGTPVFYKIPKSWKEAATDGQRWRWTLMQASEMSPEAASQASYMFAAFLQGQFDVQTMAGFARFGRHLGGPEAEDDTKKDESGPYAVSTLGEDET